MVSFFKYVKVCVLQRLKVISCTLVHTNINLQLAYDALEFQENVFSRKFRAQSVLRTLSNTYDEAFSHELFLPKASP